MLGQFRSGLIVGRRSTRACGGSAVTGFRDDGPRADDRRGPGLEAGPLVAECDGEPEALKDDGSEGELESSASARATPGKVAIAVPTPMAKATANTRPVASIPGPRLVPDFNVIVKLHAVRGNGD